MKDTVSKLFDFGGFSAILLSVYWKFLNYFNMANISDSLIIVTGILSAVYIYYKMRIVRMDFRKRKKEERDEAKNNK
jgi:hypothetical protein